ncbi:MAG: hypothetical protein U5K81_14440 [Trueperaceae bacterium]|nr:hypothetical protein [Trueperaceae bacterium]
MEAWIGPILLVLLVVTGVLAFAPGGRRDHEWVEFSASPAHRPAATVNAFTKLRANGVRCRLRNHRRTFLALGSPGYAQALLVHQDDLPEARRLVPDARIDAGGGG